MFNTTYTLNKTDGIDDIVCIFVYQKLFLKLLTGKNLDFLYPSFCQARKKFGFLHCAYYIGHGGSLEFLSIFLGLKRKKI